MRSVCKMLLCSLLFISGVALSAKAQEMPAVFLLGEDESNYEKLTSAFPRSLIAVSNNDIEVALKNWLQLTASIDEYSRSINFEIKGMKLWMHVFWNEDGSIAHIGFFFLPDSRNFKFEEVKAFFSGFIRQYKPVLKSDRKFNHYTSVSFPVLTGK